MTRILVMLVPAAAIAALPWRFALLIAGAVVLLATPSFWLGIGLILVASAWLRWLPSAGLASVGQTGGFTDRVRLFCGQSLITSHAPGLCEGGEICLVLGLERRVHRPLAGEVCRVSDKSPLRSYCTAD